jgi:putative hemolysin
MEFIVIGLLISLNGFFALSEFAFVSSKREILEELRSRGRRNAGRILSLMDHPDRFLSSIQVGITLIGIVSGTVSGIALAEDARALLDGTSFLAPYAYQISLIVVTALVTYVSILFGELVPKSIALKNPERAVLAVMPFINMFTVITYPFVAFLAFSTRLVLKITGIGVAGVDQMNDPIAEILGIAKAAAVKNKIDRKQAEIIENTMRIRDLKVAQIMVKRGDLKTLLKGMSLKDALVEAHVHHHTRYPLVDEAGDIAGYVNFKDIVNAVRINPDEPNLPGIARPLLSCTEQEKITDALRKLTKSHQHIAVVKTAGGAVTGVVFLENILETIVGDIEDEYDILPDIFYPLVENRFLAGGGVTLRKVNGYFPEVPPQDKTLSQWILENLKTPPKAEHSIEWGDLVFYQRKVSRAKVYEVIIEKRSAT